MLTTVYTLFLLVFITPAGVFTGGLIPLLLIGFADEYAVWVYERDLAAKTPIAAIDDRFSGRYAAH